MNNPEPETFSPDDTVILTYNAETWNRAFDTEPVVESHWGEG